MNKLTLVLLSMIQSIYGCSSTAKRFSESHKHITEEIILKDFDNLNVEGAYVEVDMSHSKQNKLVISGNEKSINKIKIVNESGILDISAMSGNEQRSLIKLYVSNPLRRFEVIREAIITVHDNVIHSEKFEGTVSTGAEAQIHGKTEKLILKASFGGKINQENVNLVSDEAHIKLSFGGEVTLCNSTNIIGSASTGAILQSNKESKINVRTSTSAEIKYDGCIKN